MVEFDELTFSAIASTVEVRDELGTLIETLDARVVRGLR